ncbi:MAG TPA: glycosyltransferase [Aquella sp.]|nr:glycosyltransferase [Aquella sp.]
MKLKHLFYTKEFINDFKNGSDKAYVISFVGTLHSNRYAVIKNLFRKFENTFSFYYSPARWLFLLYKLSKKSYWDIKWADVSFDKLTRQQVADIFKSSKGVLDIQRFGQTGLTMRTFEVLAAGAILITTNPYIKLADFYCPDRIIVLENMDSSINEIEMKSKIDALSLDNKSVIKNLEKYFVNNWVREFFE